MNEYTKEHWLRKEADLLEQIRKWKVERDEMKDPGWIQLAEDHVDCLEEMLKSVREVLKSYA